MTTQTAPAPAAEKTSTLTASDRCDSCNAQAYFEAELPFGEGKTGILLFCAHHFRKGEDKLRAVASKIKDESWRLEE